MILYTRQASAHCIASYHNACKGRCNHYGIKDCLCPCHNEKDFGGHVQTKHREATATNAINAEIARLLDFESSG
jgi:hypothetical protein